VISPALFNYYTSDFPGAKGLLAPFADDFNIAATDPVLVTSAETLTSDLKRIAKWAKKKHLKISTEKLGVCYFTPWNRENTPLDVFYE
jgi:hypothetical protein